MLPGMGNLRAVREPGQDRQTAAARVEVSSLTPPKERRNLELINGAGGESRSSGRRLEISKLCGNSSRVEDATQAEGSGRRAAGQSL